MASGGETVAMPQIYLRNKIRHDLVPLFKALNLKFIASFQKTQSFLQGRSKW
jgi:hypothetical protein